MGNKVSAEAVHIKSEKNDNPPPECPMHNKANDATNAKTTPSECPVQHSKNDINPYNMVRKFVI